MFAPRCSPRCSKTQRSGAQRNAGSAMRSMYQPSLYYKFSEIFIISCISELPCCLLCGGVTHLYTYNKCSSGSTPYTVFDNYNSCRACEKRETRSCSSINYFFKYFLAGSQAPGALTHKVFFLHYFSPCPWLKNFIMRCFAGLY